MSQPDDTEDSSDGKKLGWKSKQKFSFFAAAFRDAKNRSPLQLAIDAQNGASIRVLLECYNSFLSQEYTFPYYPNCTTQQPHPQELFPLDELCVALSRFPKLALNFVTKLKFVESGDELVQSGVKRHDVPIRTGVIVTGAGKRVPRGLWKRKFESESKEQGNPVEAKFVPIKGIAARESKFLASLYDAAYETGKYGAFENEVVKTVIQHKWETYIRSMFMRSLYLDIAMVLFLTLDVLFYKNESIGAPDSVNTMFSILTLVLWAYFARDELNQLRVAKTLKDHFIDFWNLLDAASLSTILVAYILRFLGEDQWSIPWFAISLPFAYLNTLYFMQGFDESGPLVMMIMGILKGIASFMIILFVCMMGFTFAFYILYNADGAAGVYDSAGPVISSVETSVQDQPYGMNSPFMR